MTSRDMPGWAVDTASKQAGRLTRRSTGTGRHLEDSEGKIQAVLLGLLACSLTGQL